MKRLALAVLVLCVALPIHAQWDRYGNSIITDEFVGIGPQFNSTTAPKFRLEVGRWAAPPVGVKSGPAEGDGASIAGDLFAGWDFGGARMRLSSASTQGFLQWNLYYNGTGLRLMDGTKPGYSLEFRHLDNADLTGAEKEGVTIRRHYPIGEGYAASFALLSIDKDGNISASGTINANYQDVAEWVPGGGELPAGTVVVLDRAKNNHVTESTKAYDSSVAGVISERPGLLLGSASESKARVATLGRVKVKVDASRRPVRIGDLLVTSDKPGMAMVSEPIDVHGVQIHRPGTLIGKALEPLAEGEGEILVLLSLQ